MHSFDAFIGYPIECSVHDRETVRSRLRIIYRAGGPNMDAKNPGYAAVLSFFIPGLGQIYNGDFLRGILWLIFTPGFWLGTGGLLGWVCHVIAPITAYQRAQLKNQQRGVA